MQQRIVHNVEYRCGEYVTNHVLNREERQKKQRNNFKCICAARVVLQKCDL